MAAVGQTIILPAGQYAEAALLTASSFGPADGTVKVTYTDGTTTLAPLTIPDWYVNDTSSVVTSTFRYTPTGTDQHPVYLFARTVALDVTKTVSTDVTVNLLSGTYHLTQPLTFTSADSGVSGHIINYVGASPPPTISGGTAITGWTQTDATRNIWSAPVPTTLATRQLYVNGVRAQVAQGPLPVTLTQTATGYTASAPTLATWGNPADIEFVYTQGVGLGS